MFLSLQLSIFIAIAKMFFIMGSLASFPVAAARGKERDLVIKDILEMDILAMFFITGSLPSFPLTAVRGKEGGDPVIKNMFEMQYEKWIVEGIKT